RLMILVYNLNNIEEMWRRYAGISGSAYAVAGAGFNVLQNDNILLIPVKAGIGARLGVNMGYLKFRPHPTVNPF
ncbi:EipA family protein, partial [Escherichia coli]|uniref:EipA family protein n=1 Tax=Escherichia coli TaxID=562 RepID=UPI001F3E0D01